MQADAHFGRVLAAYGGVLSPDYVMTDPEVKKLTSALRAGNIQLVEIHNHGFTD
jgi:drug/metabolite transporter superfamily protein YnfA